MTETIKKMHEEFVPIVAETHIAPSTSDAQDEHYLHLENDMVRVPFEVIKGLRNDSNARPYARIIFEWEETLEDAVFEKAWLYDISIPEELKKRGATGVDMRQIGPGEALLVWDQADHDYTRCIFLNDTQPTLVISGEGDGLEVRPK